MKKGSTLFLKFVICLIAIGALIWLIWFPQLEGRAANLDLISIYKDPLIIYAYIGSIPFFVALYQAFKLLGYIDGNKRNPTYDEVCLGRASHTEAVEVEYDENERYLLEVANNELEIQELTHLRK